MPTDIIKEFIVDAYGCSTNLNDPQALEEVARKSIQKVGATIVGSASHVFQPQGLTLCIILKESHFVLSTWPEHRLAIVNIFLCNPKMDPKRVWRVLQKYLRPKNTVFHEVQHRVGQSKTKQKAA